VTPFDRQILEVMSSSLRTLRGLSDIEGLILLAYQHFLGVPREKLLELAFQAWFANFELQLVISPASALHVAMSMATYPQLPRYGRDILQTVLQPWWDTCQDAEAMMRWAARGAYEVGCPEHRQVILLCCLMVRYSDALCSARIDYAGRATLLPKGMVEAVEDWAWNPGTVFVRPAVEEWAHKYHLGFANHTSIITGATERVTFLQNEVAAATERSAATAGGGWRDDLKEAGSALLADLIRAAVPVVPMTITCTPSTAVEIPHE
jgi:hypothetical protein